MAARAYLRLDPHVYDRKVLGVDDAGESLKGWTPYPAAALVAFMGALALADMQPERGRFRSERLLRELLRGAEGLGARYARQVPLLIERGDLVLKAGGRLYVDGWDEWQEGDLTVAERMRRYRLAKRNGVTPAVTAPTVTDRRASAPAGVARGRSAEAVSVSNSGGGGGAPVTRTPRSMTDDQKAETLVANRRLIEDPKTADGTRRAALQTLHRLDAATDWQAISEAAITASEAVARPRRTAGA